MVEVINKASVMNGRFQVVATFNMLNFIMKFSHCTQIEKWVLLALSLVYYQLRFQYEMGIIIKSTDFPTMFGSVAACLLNIDLDENIIRLLSTRFSKSKQTWFHSLKSMPNGVIVYNLRKSEIIFENKKLEELFSGEDMRDKYES